MRGTEEFRLAWWIVLATIPLAVVGVVAKSLLDGPLASLWVVAASLLLGSLYMRFADVMSVRSGRQVATASDAFLIGASQILALLLPGFSRSGATISTGLLLGLDRLRATRLSFLFSVPALTGAGMYALTDASAAGGLLTLAVGVVTAFVFALVSIAWLLRLVARHSFTGFIGYRVVLAVALIAMLSAGVIQP